MSSSVEKIKERLGIVEVVSAYLKVEKAGANYKAKCPFHNEKTASFFLSPDRGTYYCFGCGAKGDIFSFVEEFEGVEFKQALSLLALKAGVELVPEKREDREQRSEAAKLLDLLEGAVEFFQKQLKLPKQQTVTATIGQDVVSYLHKRGLTDATIHDWQIGYAPSEWRLLYDHLRSGAHGYDARQMLAVGLIKKNEKNTDEPYYDTFRGRIMFPLFDQAGRPVGFSGRIFVDDGKSPKYLNSPETQFFNKSEFLYGLHKAKMAIRKQDYAIVVEGQFDLIMSHQAGYANTVASSGTAFSERHIKKLENLSKRIMFAFDGDSAGFAATERSARLALSLGMEVKVAALPKGDDPASLILKNPKAWQSLITNSKHIIDFYTDSLIASGIGGRNIGKQVKEKILPFVLFVSSAIERSHFIKNISEKTGIKEEAIWDDLKSMPKPTELNGGNTSSGPGGTVSPSRHSVSRSIIGILFWQEQVKKPAIMVSDIEKRLEATIGKETLGSLRVGLEKEKEKLIFETEQYYKDNNKDTSELSMRVEELFVRLEEERLKEELTKTIISLKAAEQMKDSTLTKALLDHCHEISKKLSAIKHQT